MRKRKSEEGTEKSQQKESGGKMLIFIESVCDKVDKVCVCVRVCDNPTTCEKCLMCIYNMAALQSQLLM